MNTNIFEPISLEEMGKVQLMNRTDRKYWFHSSFLPELLQKIESKYYLLEIQEKHQIKYETTYFDTSRNKMFSAHHNGTLNRFKIRKRNYVDSGISFLEIKFKNNKGRTIKNRIPCKYTNEEFTQTENQFIATNTPFSCNELYISLVNKFTRLTLVNKNFKERCTIDLDLQFETNNKIATLDNLVIAEIKANGRDNTSPLVEALRECRIKEGGFSKYCVGKSITDPLVKHNAFKRKIRTIEKVTNQILI